MQTEGKRKFIIDFAYVILIGLLIWFIFKYAIGFLMPFILAYAVAAILQPVVGWAQRKLKFSHRVASLVSLIVFYCTVGALVISIGFGIFAYVKDQIMKLPNIYKNTIEPVLSIVLGDVSELTEGLDPTIAAAIENVAENLFSYLGSIFSTLSGAIVSFVSNVATSLPGLILKVIFGLIASYYFTVDYDGFHAFIKRQCKPTVWEKISVARGAVGSIIFSYIKSYAIILGITFVELTLAMLILGVSKFPTVALLIAVFDILPVVGTGTVLIPWSIIELIRGEYSMAIGLIVTYVVVFIVRSIIEPKIVGDQVGLHPLVTLIAMFVGTVLFGVIGLFGLPISISIIVFLNERGIIKLFK